MAMPTRSPRCTRAWTCALTTNDGWVTCGASQAPALSIYLAPDRHASGRHCAAGGYVLGWRAQRADRQPHPIAHFSYRQDRPGLAGAVAMLHPAQLDFWV